MLIAFTTPYKYDEMHKYMHKRYSLIYIYMCITLGEINIISRNCKMYEHLIINSWLKQINFVIIMFLPLEANLKNKKKVRNFS